MSDQEALVQNSNKNPFRLVTGVSRAAVGAVAVALVIVAAILLLGSVFSIWSGITNSVGGPSPNTWIKDTPLNAKSYTGTENPWYAALISMGMAVATGAAVVVVGKVFKNTPTTMKELMDNVNTVSADVAGVAGYQ